MSTNGRIVWIVFVLGIILVVNVACGAGDHNVVHMSDINFLQSSISIYTGESVTLINDSSAVHMIDNGQWVDGLQRPSMDVGALKASSSISGYGRQTLGPFTRTGTFYFYCTIHNNMNLTVFVR